MYEQYLEWEQGLSWPKRNSRRGYILYIQGHLNSKKLQNRQSHLYLIMNLINAFKKWLLNVLMPYIEGSHKKEGSRQELRFRELFKKRKSLIILGFIVFALIAFGISKSFSFIALVIACSPFVVIFWNSFGEQIIGLLNFKK